MKVDPSLESSPKAKAGRKEIDRAAATLSEIQVMLNLLPSTPTVEIILGIPTNTPGVHPSTKPRGVIKTTSRRSHSTLIKLGGLGIRS
jgi:hypothetical protein